MKNNNDQQQEIRKARATTTHRANTDVLVNSSIVEQNLAKLSERPQVRKRRRNYEKKILNDLFIMNI